MNNNGEVVIDLFELFRLFIKKIWLLIVFTFAGAAIAFCYTFFFVTPLYKSSALLYVNNSDLTVGGTSVSISSGDLTAAKSLVSTYAVILESRTVVNEVIELSGVSYTYEEMVEMVEAKAVNNTEVFSITVTSPDPNEAELLANLYARILPIKITEIVKGSDAHIVDYAVVASKKASPNTTKNTAIGAMIGLVISAAIIVIIYLQDNIIHSEEYLTENYPSIPLLAVVPDLIKSQNSNYGYYSFSSTKIIENKRPGSVAQNSESNPLIFNRNGSDGDKYD